MVAESPRGGVHGPVHVAGYRCVILKEWLFRLDRLYTSVLLRTGNVEGDGAKGYVVWPAKCGLGRVQASYVARGWNLPEASFLTATRIRIRMQDDAGPQGETPDTESGDRANGDEDAGDELQKAAKGADSDGCIEAVAVVMRTDVSVPEDTVIHIPWDQDMDSVMERVRARVAAERMGVPGCGPDYCADADEWVFFLLSFRKGC
jgi:hypothetical protein